MYSYSIVTANPTGPVRGRIRTTHSVQYNHQSMKSTVQRSRRAAPRPEPPGRAHRTECETFRSHKCHASPPTRHLTLLTHSITLVTTVTHAWVCASWQTRKVSGVGSRLEPSSCGLGVVDWHGNASLEASGASCGRAIGQPSCECAYAPPACAVSGVPLATARRPHGSPRGSRAVPKPTSLPCGGAVPPVRRRPLPSEDCRP